MLWVEYVEVLTPSIPVTVTLFGNRVIAVIIKLRRGSLGWVLIQYDQGPYKKRKFHRKAQTH